MTPSRWLELKRAIKLNNNLTATKRGDANHDPCQKYDYIYKCICHNTNALTKHASLDLCGDETTWMNASYAEPGSGVIRRGLEKPGGSRGGQTVIISDVERVRIRAYMHRHKLHERHFGIEGCNEVKMIVDCLSNMLITEDNDNTNNTNNTSNWPKAIFHEPPHMTWDNYFSGDQSMEYVASKGMGMTCTVNRGRLPGKVHNEYWHKGTTSSDDRSKAARFEFPIVAVKRDKEKYGDSVWVHTSFQSTSSCNISSVNALNHCSLYAQQRERGRGLFKRQWAIEMNEGRQLYLSTYGKIDRIDHMIKNCNMYYRSWKYWHAPMNHAKALAVVTAYDMYKECAEGKINPEWRVYKIVDFHRFRERLGQQMLTYDPRKRLYIGDEKFRVCTQQNQEQRRRTSPARSSSSSSQSTTSGIGDEECSSENASSTRLCGFLDTLFEHQESVKRFPGNNGRVCFVCGGRTSKSCTKCGVALHLLPPEGKQTKISCFMLYHNTGFFGLARQDCGIVRRRRRDWEFPSQEEMQLNSQQMRQIHKRYKDTQNETQID